MTTDLTSTLSRFINSYLFEYVWNEPFKEYRRNVKLMVLTERSVINTAQLRIGNVSLPTTNTQFYIFAINKDAFGGLVVSSTNWTSLTTLNNNNQYDLKVFSKHGKILHYNEVYVKNDPYNKFLLIAINKKMFKTILGSTYSTSDVFIELYYDSDVPNDVTVYSSHVTTAALRQSAYNHITEDTSLVLLNGKPSQVLNLSDITLNDYVDVINDTNLSIEFDIDFTINDDNRVFLSTRDNMLKQIVHIPKELNPDNHVITHNTCDVYAYPKYNSGCKKGLLIHRAQTDKSFSQITHNDFAIPLYLIEDYQVLLGTEELVLRVQCREHNKNNILIPNNSYIDLLYTHNNNEILDFLEAEVDVPFTFWSADELEQCKYVSMFFDVPETINASNVADYVNALGYYQVLSLICPRIQRYTYKENLEVPFGIVKPTIFTGTPVKLHTYLDGYKTPNTTTELDGILSVDLPEASSYSTGDSLVIECFEYPNNNIYEFTPTEEEHTFTLPYSSFNLYEKTNSDSEFKGINNTSNDLYTKVNITSQVMFIETIDSVTTITFAVGTYGKTYSVQNDKASYILQKDISLDMDDMYPLVIDAITLTHNTEEVRPILNINDVVVHLNNKALVKDIDYKLIMLGDTEDSVSFYQIVIQNDSYLSTDNNNVEIMTLPNKATHITSSFLRDSYIPQEVGMLFDNLSLITVDGRVVKNVNITNNGYDVSSIEPRLGAIYELRTLTSPTIEQYIDTYYKESDNVRRQQLIDYFNTIATIDDDLIVIPYSHRIYSVYLASIIKDILNDTLVIGVEPDPEKILPSLSQYLYLKEFDIVYQNTDLNLKYLDLLGTYLDYAEAPVAKYTLIQQIISTGLPVDTIVD